MLYFLLGTTTFLVFLFFPVVLVLSPQKALPKPRSNVPKRLTPRAKPTPLLFVRWPWVVEWLWFLCSAAKKWIAKRTSFGSEGTRLAAEGSSRHGAALLCSAVQCTLAHWHTRTSQQTLPETHKKKKKTTTHEHNNGTEAGLNSKIATQC